MMKFYTCFLVFSLAAFSGHAGYAQQLGQCPAPLMEGAWTIGEGPISFGRAYTQYVPIVPSGVIVQGDVKIDSCSNSSFTLEFNAPDVGFISAEMSVLERSGNNGILYSGSSPTSYGSVDFQLLFGNPRQAVGVSVFRFPNGVGSATFDVLMQSTSDPARYECNCKNELIKWISEQVSAAEQFRDAFSNQQYYERPSGVPEEHWNDLVYESMIYFIVGNEMSHDDAAAAAVKSHFFSGESVVQVKRRR